MKGPLFYSKILLFGEYGIIKDSRGLSIPYNFYKGALKKGDELSENAEKSNQSLKKFSHYLQQLQEDRTDLVSFDIDKLNADIADGMYFDSSIPQGYGVGRDRKSTRLNSSHVRISYAVFCLKKKKIIQTNYNL